jgi:hypothetical protein
MRIYYTRHCAWGSRQRVRACVCGGGGGGDPDLLRAENKLSSFSLYSSLRFYWGLFHSTFLVKIKIHFLQKYCSPIQIKP